MRCYYGRAFIATDNHVKQLSVFGRESLQNVENGRRANGQLGGSVVHDGRCIQFRSQYGVISASCANDGGFFALGALSPDPAWRANFKKFSDQSYATEFMADRLTNLPDPAAVEFYGTVAKPKLKSTDEVKAVGGSEEGEEQFEIIQVGNTDGPLNEKAAIAMAGEQKQYEGRVARVFLSKNVMFAIGYDNSVRPVNLVKDHKIVPPQSKATFRAAPGPILSMTSSALGMVAELDEGVSILNKGNWTSIFDEPTYSIRGYPSAKYYRKLLTVVGEERTELIFVTQ